MPSSIGQSREQDFLPLQQHGFRSKTGGAPLEAVEDGRLKVADNGTHIPMEHFRDKL